MRMMSMDSRISNGQSGHFAYGACGERAAGGFTLVEILIVVMILAVLAAIVVPRYQSHSADAEVATLKSNLYTMRVMLEQYHATHGAWPEAIDPTWFAGGLPSHPQNKYGIPSFEVASRAKNTDPKDRFLTDSSAGAYWYNNANGNIRARILSQDTLDASNALYAEVNSAE